VGCAMTATGVTPDMVLDIFLMLCFAIAKCNKLATMATNREIFNEIAESWYRIRHWCRFTAELKEIAKRWQHGKLLNVGCAHGPDFLPFTYGFELFGIDFSSQMVEMAQKYADKFKFKVNLAVADAIYLPFSDSSFDGAIAVASYHHIKGKMQRQIAFTELRRVLKPGSEAFITVWNRWQPGFWLRGKEVKVPWKSSNKTLFRYYYLYSYCEFQRALAEAGFKVINMYPEKSFKFPVKLLSRNICALVKAI
jgi:tRNA (uracil-5-)-methyltransferase TRM9